MRDGGQTIHLIFASTNPVEAYVTIRIRNNIEGLVGLTDRPKCVAVAGVEVLVAFNPNMSFWDMYHGQWIRR